MGRIGVEEFGSDSVAHAVWAISQILRVFAPDRRTIVIQAIVDAFNMKLR